MVNQEVVEVVPPKELMLRLWAIKKPLHFRQLTLLSQHDVKHLLPTLPTLQQTHQQILKLLGIPKQTRPQQPTPTVELVTHELM